MQRHPERSEGPCPEMAPITPPVHHGNTEDTEVARSKPQDLLLLFPCFRGEWGAVGNGSSHS